MAKYMAVYLPLVLYGSAAASGAPAAQHEDGPWRFTAMSERLIRIEYDEQHRFVDEQTLAFVRSRPLGLWQHAAIDGGDGWSVLNTSEVSVRYRRNQPPALGSVVVASRSGPLHAWSWGDDPEVGNLRGTARTLDSSAQTLDLNCHKKVSPTMENSEMHCAWGLVSREGWAVVNDTGAPIWRDGWYAPSRNSMDISIFLHGLDFEGALKDFAHAAGKPTLPPRYALGTMFTRWFNFDSDSVMSLIEDFESRSVPLDAWIFDMNWHMYGPWGSFTWNQDSFPALQKMLDAIQAKKLHIGANVHEHDGISSAEQTYKEVCAALGRAPGKNIPFDLYNKSYAMAQEDISVRAISTKHGQQGIDFFWIDYQQGETDSFEKTKIPNINPTIVLNSLRSSLPARHGEDTRSLIVSRWGGLGSHRYPVGFSGDQQHSWEGLAFLPYFTSTAANVAFGYWSHDTVGGDHDVAIDYELSVRWVQTSAWSPVLRFHDKGAGTGDCAITNVCAKVVPWHLPDAFFMAIRDASQRRDELIPYIYTAVFDGAPMGRALVRPMYYEDPSDASLYGLDRQYLFGPDMVISPITMPSGPDAKGFEQALGAVTWTVYAPSSRVGWVDRLNGDFAAGKEVTSAYGIFDVPGLVRQGAVIPMRPRLGGSNLGRAGQPLGAVEFRIFPAEVFYIGGSIHGSASVVDDDGITTGYLKGQFATTHCAYSFTGRTFKISFSQEGDFVGRPSRATLRLSFPQLPELHIRAQTKLSSAATVTYDHQLLGTVITFADVDLTAGPTLEVAISHAYPDVVLSNFVGALGRVRRARYMKDALDALNVHYGANRANLTSYVLASTRMSPAFAATLPQLWEGATAQVAELLATDKTLRQDARRSSFISKILRLHAAEAETSRLV